MMLSPICTVVESTTVWVPLTVKLPTIVTFWPLTVIAVSTSDWNVSKSPTLVSWSEAVANNSVSLSSADAENVSKEDNLPSMFEPAPTADYKATVRASTEDE